LYENIRLGKNIPTGNLENVDRSHGAFRKNADPFFDIIRKGLNDEVDGDQY